MVQEMLGNALWFDPKTRVSLSGNVCLKRRLNVKTEGLLYAKQYVRTPSGELQPLPVLYLNIDLLSLDSVSIEDKTFRAKFYLDMRSLTEISLADVRLLNQVGLAGVVVRTAGIVADAPTLAESVCTDPDDDKFLACALAGKTKIVISEYHLHCARMGMDRRRVLLFMRFSATL